MPNFLAMIAVFAICGGAAAEAVWRLSHRMWAAYRAVPFAVPAAVATPMALGLGFVREIELTYWDFAYSPGYMSVVTMPCAMVCAFIGIRMAQRMSK